jgi:transposase-like protein
MSVVMEEEIKRWTARRKSALVLEIIQGKTTVSEASRQFDIPPSEIGSWVDEGKRGMENALRAKPEDVRGKGAQAKGPEEVSDSNGYFLWPLSCNLTTNRTYTGPHDSTRRFRVRACNPNGCSAWTLSIQAVEL